MMMKNGKVIKNKGATEEAVGELPNIGPVNNVMHSLFDRVTCELNGIDINNSNKYYPWKSYITNLLSYNSEAKASWMQEFGW